ncbi:MULTISPECIES: hypothetical protein [Mycobacterium]|uniref:Uncharacterized protein n=1 Tax=Mycobacterium talmoniae TaxID=1858794 RepID=A0A2S8BN27_9MYCO|nr:MULTISPECIES: hypothetical protein [Mycobacterium]PQM48048.1 hypothetical protein C1Y40_01737 [Mycobacterium talmoniae]
MTGPVPEANDADLAAQSAPVTDPDDARDESFSVDAEADAADLFEQHRSAPLPDDDYDR